MAGACNSRPSAARRGEAAQTHKAGARTHMRAWCGCPARWRRSPRGHAATRRRSCEKSDAEERRSVRQSPMHRCPRRCVARNAAESITPVRGPCRAPRTAAQVSHALAKDVRARFHRGRSNAARQTHPGQCRWRCPCSCCAQRCSAQVNGRRSASRNCAQGNRKRVSPPAQHAQIQPRSSCVAACLLVAY